MDSDKVKCLNCLTDELDDSLSIKVETGDTSATIYYDENGVLVKKTVTNNGERKIETIENTPPDIQKKEEPSKNK